jgi:hypothetical protein
LFFSEPRGYQVMQKWNWEEIPREAVDWDAGRIIFGPRDDPANPPEQASIEAEWEAVRHAVSHWQSQQSNVEVFADRARLQASSKEVSPEPMSDQRQRGGGRRRKHDWPYVTLKLLQRLQDDGAPAEGDGGQAELEGYAASLFPPDACPSESLIREWVHGTIKAYKRSLG